MNSRENMGALGTRIANMGQTLMQTAIRTGVAAGVSAAAAHIEEEHRKEAKERTDRRLHNTRLLLKTAGAIYNAKQAKEKESAASILDGLESYTRDDSLYIESIKRSQERTLIILAHIEKMLDLYRVWCQQNGTEEDARRYEVVMETYIREPKKSVQEIAGTFGIERRTVYKDLNAAIQPLTALFFGIDAVKAA